MSIEKLRFDLKRPLLIMKAPNGFLACGYINPETCNRTEEACAIVTGVSDFDEMVSAKVVSLSKRAHDLGIAIGDTGEEALRKLA